MIFLAAGALRLVRAYIDGVPTDMHEEIMVGTQYPTQLIYHCYAGIPGLKNHIGKYFTSSFYDLDTDVFFDAGIMTVNETESGTVTLQWDVWMEFYIPGQWWTAAM